MYFFMYDNLFISHFHIYHNRVMVTHMMLHRQENMVKKNEKCCLICNKEFASERECQNHYKICRSSLICLKCNKSFDKLCTFQAHGNICAGLDKFKCSVCGLCFSDKKKAHNHMYNCRKKFTCRRCSMPFHDWKLLVNHCKLAHPKIECKICCSFFLVQKSY